MNIETMLSALTKAKAWSGNPENAPTLGAHSRSVQKQLRNAQFKINKLKGSMSSKPSIGIYGPSQVGKSYLTAKLAENKNNKLITKLDKNYNFLTEINPAGGKESTALVTRFTTDLEPIDPKFPVKARILSEEDLVCILANSYYFDNTDPNYPSSEDIHLTLNEHFSNNENDENNENVSQIESYLDEKVFSRDLRERFSPVWSAFGAMGSKITPNQKVSLYALFWNNNSRFTELFIALSNLLEQIKQSNYIYLPMISILPRDTSVIDVATLEQLGNIEASSTITVKYGKNKIDVQRALLCAVISELVLPIDQPKNDLFEQADLLDFPGARTRFEREIDLNITVGMNEFFLRGKIDFLFQKYSMNHGIDALILCVKPGPMNVRDLPKSVDDWISCNAIKSAKNSNLFLSLTRFDEHIPDAAGRADNDGARFDNSIESGLLQPFLTSDDAWPTNWDGANFKNVFPIRNPNYPLEGYFKYARGKEVSVVKDKLKRFSELRTAFLATDNVKKFIKSPAKKWDSLLSANDGGVLNLTSELEDLDLKDLKGKNADIQISTIKKDTLNILSQYYMSDDSNERFESEREIFEQIYPQILKIYTSGNFPTLLNMLSMKYETVLACLKNNARGSDDANELNIATNGATQPAMPDILTRATNESTEPNLGTELEPQDTFTKMADAVLSSWINSITLGHDASSILIKLNTEQTAFEFITKHVAHENRISQLRKSLSEKFKNWDFGLASDANLLAITKISCETINAAVAPRTLSRVNPLAFDGVISDFTINTPPSTQKVWEKWINNFGQAIEANCQVDSISNYNKSQNDQLKFVLDELRPQN